MERWQNRRSGGYCRNYELSPSGLTRQGAVLSGVLQSGGWQARVLHRSSWAVTPVDKEDSPFNNGFREGSIIPRNRYIVVAIREKTIRVGELANRWIYYDVSNLSYHSILSLFYFVPIFYLYTTVFDKLARKNERPILLTTDVTYHRWETFAREEFSRKLNCL